MILLCVIFQGDNFLNLRHNLSPDECFPFSFLLQCYFYVRQTIAMVRKMKIWLTQKKLALTLQIRWTVKKGKNKCVRLVRQIYTVSQQIKLYDLYPMERQFYSPKNRLSMSTFDHLNLIKKLWRWCLWCRYRLFGFYSEPFFWMVFRCYFCKMT